VASEVKELRWKTSGSWTTLPSKTRGDYPEGHEQVVTGELVRGHALELCGGGVDDEAPRLEADARRP
jgi:hypothetical protein